MNPTSCAQTQLVLHCLGAPVRMFFQFFLIYIKFGFIVNRFSEFLFIQGRNIIVVVDNDENKYLKTLVRWKAYWIHANMLARVVSYSYFDINYSYWCCVPIQLHFILLQIHFIQYYSYGSSNMLFACGFIN